MTEHLKDLHRIYQIVLNQVKAYLFKKDYEQMIYLSCGNLTCLCVPTKSSLLTKQVFKYLSCLNLQCSLKG